MRVSHSFLYEEQRDGAAILRCFLRDGTVEVPDQLDGVPVTSLAPYAFSAQMDDAVRTEAKKEGLLPDEPGMCGERLAAISLPATLGRVGRYCFYNCSHLQRISFGESLNDWGSGSFSGCHHITSVCADLPEDHESSLQHLLLEISEELRVTLGKAVLVFPEFYEEGVENTPARILQTHIHGSGLLYRNCFQGKTFDFDWYDSLFPYALAQEREELIAGIVTGRLRHPCHLTDQASKRYDDWVREHLVFYGTSFLNRDDPAGLSWFLERFTPGREELVKLSVRASDCSDAQLQSILMEYRHSHNMGSERRKWTL